MLDDPHALKIYIDGNAYNNPGGAGGYAGIAEYPDDSQPPTLIFSEGFRHTTNNRMELSACIHAYRYVRENGAALGVQRVQVITDSQYVYNGIRSAPYWKQNKWRNRDNRPVENDDLWDDLLSLKSKVKIRVDLVWRKGKKSELLKAIDKAAKAAGKEPWNEDRGFRQGKVGRAKVKGGSSQLFPAAGQEATITIYRKMVVGRSKEPKIFFTVTAAAGVIEKFRAYTTPEVALDLKRGHTYTVEFNSDPKYPQIVLLIGSIIERE